MRTRKTNVDTVYITGVEAGRRIRAFVESKMSCNNNEKKRWIKKLWDVVKKNVPIQKDVSKKSVAYLYLESAFSETLYDWWEHNNNTAQTTDVKGDAIS